MIPCPKCAGENDDEALYCDQCAAPIAESVQGAVLETPCPACGGDVREVPAMVAVCQGCGIHLGEAGAVCREAAALSQAQEAAPTAAEPVEKTPCPVCETPNGVGAGRCSSCGIAFKKLTRPVECPKCQAESMDDKCDCGAVLTLAKLLEYVDDSIEVVCPVCKQVFSRRLEACSDCGGELRSAAALKEYASRRR